jgi:vancomycin permeability regulator SanA
MGEKGEGEMRRWLRWAEWLLLAWILGHLIYTTIDGLRPYRGNADIAIVLGNRVLPDSTLSPVLKARVDKALELYQQGRVPRIMVSGGNGHTTKPGRVPEGMAMKLYLVAHGVPADRIIEDNEGENTYLTAKDLLPVADSLHLHSAIAVSSFYHLTRTKYIIRKLGFRKVHGVASDGFFVGDDLFGLLRDCVAFYKYVLVY